MRNLREPLICIALVVALVVGINPTRAQFRMSVVFGPTPDNQGHGYDDYLYDISCKGSVCLVAELHEDWSVPFGELTKRFLRSTDGGVSWVMQATTLPVWLGVNSGTIEQVQQIDSLNAVGVGDSALIVRTTDGGAHWIRQYAPEECSGVYYVHFGDPSNGIAMGPILKKAGSMIVTSDGGNSWTFAPFSRPGILRGHCYGPGRFSAFQYPTGKIFTTTDSWRTVDSTESPFDPVTDLGFTNAAFSNSNVVVAYGSKWDSVRMRNHGIICRSTDLGKHWESQIQFSDPYFPSLNFMTAIDGDIIVAGSSDGSFDARSMLRSTDQGRTWGIDTIVYDKATPSPTVLGLSSTATGTLVGIFGAGATRGEGFIARGNSGKFDVGRASVRLAQNSRIYPNPATDHIAIAHTGESGNIVLMDMLGREAMRCVMQSDDDSKLDVSHLAGGIYAVGFERAGLRRYIGSVTVMK